MLTSDGVLSRTIALHCILFRNTSRGSRDLCLFKASSPPRNNRSSRIHRSPRSKAVETRSDTKYCTCRSKRMSPFNEVPCCIGTPFSRLYAIDLRCSYGLAPGLANRTDVMCFRHSCSRFADRTLCNVHTSTLLIRSKQSHEIRSVIDASRDEEVRVCPVTAACHDTSSNLVWRPTTGSARMNTLTGDFCFAVC